MHRAQGRKGLPRKPQEERAWSFSSAGANLRGDSVFIHTGGLPCGGLSFSPRFVERNAAAALETGLPALKCLLLGQVPFLPTRRRGAVYVLFGPHQRLPPFTKSIIFLGALPFGISIN